jgi:hypothetical protein
MVAIIHTDGANKQRRSAQFLRKPKVDARIRGLNTGCLVRGDKFLPVRLQRFCLFSRIASSIKDAMALDDRKIPQDPTPIVGAPTDIAPLTHLGPKPPHERTADEEAGAIDWERLAASDRFRNLLKAKRRFVVPAMIFFIVYYFALPVLIGYARPFMEKRVLGRRRRRGRRLHERGLLPRDRGSDRFLRLRRIHVLGRLARYVSHCVARRGGTAAQRRQVHHGGCPGLSVKSAARPRDGGDYFVTGPSGTTILPNNSLSTCARPA